MLIGAQIGPPSLTSSGDYIKKSDASEERRGNHVMKNDETTPLFLHIPVTIITDLFSH